MVSVINLKCSNCGDVLSERQTICESCMQPVVIKKMSSLMGLSPQELNKRGRLIGAEASKGGEFASDANFTAGCCFLRLKLYDQAFSRFEKAFNEDMDNAEAYFYAAVARLMGKRPFLCPLVELRKAQEYAEAAMAIDDRAIFHYFLAYIKLDFYAKKFLKVTPDWRQEYQESLGNYISKEDVDDLFNLLGQQCPKELEL